MNSLPNTEFNVVKNHEETEHGLGAIVEGEEDSQEDQSESVTDTDTQTEAENEASVPKVGE